MPMFFNTRRKARIMKFIIRRRESGLAAHAPARSCNFGIRTPMRITHPTRLVPASCGPMGRYFTAEPMVRLERLATPPSTTPKPKPGPPALISPDGLDVADGPAALLPNGNVLVQTSPG